mgnify:CR=1 FL=1
MLSWLDGLSPSALMAFWTITVAALCSLMCAWLGVWLVLQRESLIGDAISHSVLPGLALTFIWFGQRDPIPMLIGASVAGLLTTVLIRGLSSLTKVKNDASMGVVFSVFFALGVILITQYASHIDLDPGCVLYGLIEFVAIDTFEFAGTHVPQALINIVPALLVVGVFLLLFNKELKIMAFDGRLASTLGKRPSAMYFALMAMVAVATVASFEAVGSILVIAMLIGPAAAAQLLSRKLTGVFGWASVFAIASSVFGYLLAVLWNTSVAGMMSVVIGAIYVFSALLSPDGGIISKAIQRRQLQAANKTA